MVKGRRLQKMLAAFVIGALAAGVAANVDARRVHDPKVLAKVEVNPSAGVDENRDGAERETRVGSIMRHEVTPHSILRPSEEIEAILQPALDAQSLLPDEKFEVPQTVSPYDTSIRGTAIASQEQCVRYLLRNNPSPRLSVTAEEIVAYYYEEGAREGIRPDVAFAQALKETGFFRYGGDVVPEQNNYCGLGTTGGGVKGGYFESPQMGVRAHIQHLLAYSSTRKPTTPIIDPRYHIVRNAYGARTLGDWQDLNGRWAVPGNSYGQEILSMYKAILKQ